MGEISLHVTVNASRAFVWHDFVDMMAFAEWWWPFADTTYAADVRVGGTYRFASDSAGIGVHGQYHAVTEAEELSFTWQWEDDEPQAQSPISSVQITLDDAAEGVTTVNVVHQAGDDELDNLRQGWEHCLQRLIARYP